MAQIFVKIPRGRIGVLIGPNGCVKEYIEKKLSVRLEIESETGNVAISKKEGITDPSLLLRAKDVVLAIASGFSPERAYKLLQDENNVLIIIDLREIFGRSQSDIRRIKGRIIGKEGKTRRFIEEMTDAFVSVHGHNVAIIGGLEQAEAAREAVSLLIKGSQHVTIHKYLQRKRRELKRRRLELWEGSRLIPEET